jgi:hypothetical protein
MPMILTAWLLSVASHTAFTSAVPDASAGAEFLVQIFGIILGLHLIEKAIDKELRVAGAQESDEFDELKSVLMAEAKRQAKKQAARDPDRTLTAVCHSCDNDIYSDDTAYTNGNNNVYCDVCWDIGAQK